MRSWVALMVLVAGCTRSRPTPGPAASVSASSGPTGSAVVSVAVSEPEEAPPPPPPSGPWIAAVRAQRWAEARTLLEGLPEADRERAEIRLVRAKVARMTGDPAGVVARTAGLDLKLAASTVARFRAEAALEVGPYEEAAAYYVTRPGPRAALRAGLAYERAGQREEAKRQLDRAVSAARGESAEGAARTARSRVEEALGQTREAVADARWVWLHAPAGSDEATARLARLDPGARPTATERLDRAGRLAAAGRATETLAEVDAAAQAPGAPSPEALAEQRGGLLFKLRRYAEAAEALSPAARKAPAGDAAFAAARALSRAQRDEEAIVAYRALVAADARGPHAEEATYLIGRLQLLLGQHAEAARSYGGYLRKYRRGKFHQAAAYDRALALVDSGQAAAARTAFAELARAEENRGEAARLRQLEGVAAQKAGDAAGARQIYTDVMRDQPLSWAAQMAQARLTQLGAPGVTMEPGPARGGPALEVKLPAGVRFLHQLGLDDEAEEALRTDEGALVAAAGSRGPEALCEAYGQLDTASRRFRVAQDRVKVELVMRDLSDGNRWAWECLFPRPYQAVVQAVEAREGLPAGLVYAVMRQESSFDPSAVSPALAEGLLQLLPTTAREVAKRGDMPFADGTIQQPSVNIDLGGRYLGMLLRQWKGNLPLAVASYNAGPKAVSRWVERSGVTETDLWVAHIPYGETRTYVGRVLGNLARYARMNGSSPPSVALAVDPTLRAEEGAF